MIALGGMGEWLKPTDLKSVKAVTSSGVRIPLPPPEYQSIKRDLYNFTTWRKERVLCFACTFRDILISNEIVTLEKKYFRQIE